MDPLNSFGQSSQNRIAPGRIRAFTLVESVIASLILVISFSATLLVINRILSGDELVRKTRARLVLQEKLEETRVSGDLSPAVWQVDDLQIERKATLYNESNHVVRVELTAYVTQRKIASLHILMPAN